MRFPIVLSAAVIISGLAGCQTGPSETDKKIIKSLDEITKQLAIVNKELKEIKENSEEAPLPPSQMPHFRPRKANLKVLRKIKLEKNPTQDQVKRYIGKIINASRGQNQFSPSDPQVAMLSKIGSKNASLLLRFAQNYYAQMALPYIVTEKNKAEVLKALRHYPNLITCVVRNNWTKDAKETIFDRLRHYHGYLQHGWLNAATQLATPKEYSILQNYFVNGSNPQETYKALSQLEGFNLKKAVDAAWKKQNLSAHPYQRQQLAMIAARYGYIDALQYLVQACRGEMNQHSRNQMLGSLYQLTGQSLTPGKMATWFKKNQAKLVFNPEDEKWVVKGNTVTK